MATEEQTAAAGEYVLGTLSGPERAAFARELESEPELREAVAFWQSRLAPLVDAIPAETPPERVWAAIAAVMGRAPAAGGGAPAANDNVVELQRRVRFWRGASLAAGALAAALGFVAWFGSLQPDVTPLAAGRFVAVVDTEGREPAMIVTVDTGTGTVSVRTLTAEVPADKSLELWYIDEKTEARSLGVVDEENAARVLNQPIPELRQGNPGSLIAITLEPKGGSPTGVATGPIVYTGKLIRDE